MTTEQAIKVYLKCFPNDTDIRPPDYLRREMVAGEIRSVCAAKTKEDAAKVIEWWDWDSDRQMHGAVMRIRNTARKQGLLVAPYSTEAR